MTEVCHVLWYFLYEGSQVVWLHPVAPCAPAPIIFLLFFSQFLHRICSQGQKGEPVGGGGGEDKFKIFTNIAFCLDIMAEFWGKVQ